MKIRKPRKQILHDAEALENLFQRSEEGILPLGRLIRYAYRAYMRVLEPALLTNGMTTGSWAFMRVMWEKDGMTQVELSRRMLVTQPTTVRAIDRLERLAYVERRQTDQDRRKIRITLTDEGHALEHRLEPLARHIDSLMRNHLSNQEQIDLTFMLKTVIKSLGRYTEFHSTAVHAADALPTHRTNEHFVADTHENLESYSKKLETIRRSRQTQKPDEVLTPFTTRERDDLGNLVREAARAHNRALEPTLKANSVSSGIWFFLRLLWLEDGLSQTELSHAVKVKEPTTVRAIDRMERLGLVTRKKDADDKRKMLVYLTKKGEGLKDKLMPFAAQANNAAADSFSEIELEYLCRLLRKVASGLEARDVHEATDRCCTD